MSLQLGLLEDLHRAQGFMQWVSKWGLLKDGTCERFQVGTIGEDTCHFQRHLMVWNMESRRERGRALGRAQSMHLAPFHPQHILKETISTSRCLPGRDRSSRCRLWLGLLLPVPWNHRTGKSSSTWQENRRKPWVPHPASDDDKPGTLSPVPGCGRAWCSAVARKSPAATSR